MMNCGDNSQALKEQYENDLKQLIETHKQNLQDIMANDVKNKMLAASVKTKDN